MSGKIKTGASTWATASEMRVKTATNSWSTVSKAFVKTAANTWSQWFIAPIKDTFTRTTSGSIGTADTGQVWETLAGTWFSNGSQAQSNTAATSYPVARVNYGDVSATVSATPSPGTGPAVWVNSSGDWYAAVLYEDQANGTYPCNCSCNGHYEYYPIWCDCGANCSVCGSTSSTSTYGAIGTQTGTTYVYSGSATATDSCPYASYPYLSQGRCWNSSFSAYTTPTTTYSCSGGTVCCQPGVNSCYIAQATYTYSCNPGDTLSGTTCTHTTTTCNSCSSPSCGQCGTGSYFVSGGSYPSCDGYGSSCQICGTLITRYFLRLIKSVGGAISYPVADIALSSEPATISIAASNGVLSYKAYSDTSMTNILGSGTHTPSTPITATYHGIVKTPSAYAQGSTVDNVSISG